MEEYEIGKRGEIKDGIYWVFDKVKKSLVVAEASSGKFYYYNPFDAFYLEVDVTHYKKIAEPRGFKREPSTCR